MLENLGSQAGVCVGSMFGTHEDGQGAIPMSQSMLQAETDDHYSLTNPVSTWPEPGGALSGTYLATNRDSEDST